MSERGSFDAVSVTRAGGREVNEDYVDVLHTADASCWVIADGLGGHRGGAIASKLVVESALRSFQEQPQVAAEQVERHCEQAQEALLAAQRSDASLAQMRSTIVVLVDIGAGGGGGTARAAALYSSARKRELRSSSRTDLSAEA